MVLGYLLIILMLGILGAFVFCSIKILKNEKAYKNSDFLSNEIYCQTVIQNTNKNMRNLENGNTKKHIMTNTAVKYDSQKELFLYKKYLKTTNMEEQIKNRKEEIYRG